MSKKTFDDHLQERRNQKYGSTKLWSPDPHLVGMIGERVNAEFFGAEQDLTNKPGGDGGVDLLISLLDNNGSARWWNVDAKGNTYGDWLRVDRKIIQPDHIYVLVHVYLDTRSGYCVGWQWGKVLMREKLRNWCNNGTYVYAIHKDKPLRQMSILKERFTGWKHSPKGAK